MLRQEKDQALSEYQELKAKLAKFRLDESKRQKQMAADAHDAEDKIVSLKELAERIIRISILCSRLETEAERVNEVERLDPEQQREIEEEAKKLKEQEDIGMAQLQGKAEAEEQVVRASEELKYIYKKLGNATIDRLALQREQALLEKENQELREALQRFLSVGTVGGI